MTAKTHKRPKNLFSFDCDTFEPVGQDYIPSCPTRTIQVRTQEANGLERNTRSGLIAPETRCNPVLSYYSTMLLTAFSNTIRCCHGNRSLTVFVHFNGCPVISFFTCASVIL